VTAGGPPDVDTVRRYRDLGVGRFVVPPPAFDPDGVRQGLEMLGEHVIAKL
jgi:hypothetical protein